MRIQNTPFGSNPFKRGIAIITVALFVFTQLLSYAPAAFAKPFNNIQVQGGNPSGLFRLDREPEIRIPPELGLIDESFHGTSGKTILYIQDAHDSLEAQENIAKIINHLISNYGVKIVFEEGYEGPVPTDKYFGFIKDPKIKEKVSWFFMDHLRLGGAEYAHINRTRDFNLVGADSLKLHKENVEQYRLSAEKKGAVTKDLKALAKEFYSLADRRFPKELKAWLKVKEQFDAKKLDLVTYLGRTMPLLGEHGAEKGLGLIRFLIEAMKTHDPVVIEKAKHIDAREVFGELAKLEESIRETCLKDATDKKLFDYYKILGLLNRLNELQVSQEEYEAVKASLKVFDTESFAHFIFSQAPKTLILSRMWERNIKDAIRFYEIAQERDHSISEMLNRYSVGNGKEEEWTPKPDASVLVFGGFHKESIKRILEAKGISYLIVSPRITKPSPRHEQFYKCLMTDGKLSFELPANIRIAVRAENRIVEWNANPMLARMEFRTLIPIAEKISNHEDFSLVAEQAMKAFRSEMRDKVDARSAGDDEIRITEETINKVKKMPQLFNMIRKSEALKYFFSPDDRYLFVLYRNRSAEVFDMETAESLKIDTGFDVKEASFSPDGKHLFVLYFNNSAKVFDVLRTPDPEIRIDKKVTYHSFSLTTRYLRVGYSDGSYQIFDIQTKQNFEFTIDFAEDATAITFSEDGKHLLVRCPGHIARVVAIQRENDKVTVKDTGISIDIHNCSPVFSPDGRFLSVWDYGHQPESVRVFDLEDGRSMEDRIGTDVSGAFVSPRDKYLFIRYQNGYGKVLDAKDKKERDFKIPIGYNVDRPFFSDDGRYLLVRYRDNYARVIDLQTNKDVGISLGPNVSHPIFSPDGKYLYVQYHGDTAKVYDLAAAQPVDFDVPIGPKVHGAFFSTDGQYLCVAHLSASDPQEIFDIKTGKKVQIPHGEDAVNVIASPEIEYLYVRYRNGSRKIFDIRENNKDIGVSIFSSPPSSNHVEASFLEDGKRIIIYSNDYSAPVFDLEAFRDPFIQKVVGDFGTNSFLVLWLLSIFFSKNEASIQTTESPAFDPIQRKVLVLLENAKQFFEQFDKVNTAQEISRRLDRDHYFESNQKKIFDLYEIMGEDTFRVLKGLLVTNPYGLDRFLDAYDQAPSPVKAVLARYYETSGRKQMQTFLKLLEIVSSYPEDYAAHLTQDIEANMTKTPEELLGILSKNYIILIAAEAGVEAALISPEAIEHLPFKFIPRITQASNFLKRNHPSHSEIFKELLRLMFLGRTKDFFVNTDQSSAVGRTIATHNEGVRRAIEKAGIDLKRWLEYDKEDLVILSEHGPATDPKDQIGRAMELVLEGASHLTGDRHFETFQQALSKANLTLTKDDKPPFGFLLVLKENGQRIPHQPDSVTRAFSNLSNLKVIQKTVSFLSRNAGNENARLDFFHLNELLLSMISFMEAPEGIDALGGERYRFKLSRWRRDPAHDFFLGDFTGCCMATNSNTHFEAMIDHLVDQGIQVVEVIDEDKGETIALVWLFLAVDDKGNPHLVIDNIEIRGSYTMHQEKIKNALITYSTQYAKDIGAKSLLAGNFVYSHVNVNEYPFRKIKLTKMGGYWGSQKYYLEALGSESVHVVHEFSGRSEMRSSKKQNGDVHPETRGHAPDLSVFLPSWARKEDFLKRLHSGELEERQKAVQLLIDNYFGDQWQHLMGIGLVYGFLKRGWGVIDDRFELLITGYRQVMEDYKHKTVENYGNNQWDMKRIRHPIDVEFRLASEAATALLGHVQAIE